MNAETLQILQFVIPGVAAAVGSVIATKVSVAQLRADVNVLFKKVDKMTTEAHSATLKRQQELGYVRESLAALEVQVQNLDSPWKPKPHKKRSDE